MNNFDYKNMTPFKWFVLENFPFIENDFDAINNYHLFSKVVEYLNKTIDNMNLTGEQMENVTNAMTELQNYVNNYFDNLDVQDEINNKLNKMAEDGTLRQIMIPFFDELQNSINEERTMRQNVDNSLQAQINGLSSGSPIPVNSIEQMTDTTKIYVNTSNGHKYYYNGNEWVDFGAYQASELLPDNEYILDIHKNNYSILESVYNTYVKRELPTCEAGGIISDTTGNYSINSSFLTTLRASKHFIFIPKNKEISVKPNGTRINLYFYDEELNFIEAKYDNASLSENYVTFTNINYTFMRIGAYKSTITDEDFYNIEFSINNNFNNLLTHNLEIQTPDKVNFNTTDLTITFGYPAFLRNSKFATNVSNKTYNLDFVSNGGWVFYDKENDVFTSNSNFTNYFIGAIWKINNKYYIDLFINENAKISIDGMPYKRNNYFIGKTCNCLGDSMTFGVGTSKPYYQWFSQLCGIKNVNNYGVSGSCISPKTETYPDWEADIPSFLERYNEMSSADIITVFGGVNDWVTGRDLGNINDTQSTTFYGALKQLCEGLIQKYPTGKIIFISSPQNNYVNRTANIPSDNQYYRNTEGYNRKGYKLQDYSNAMLEVCKIYGIPCLNLTDNLWWGLSGNLSNGVYGTDNLHPNDEGHKLIALKMSSFINRF